MFTAFKGPALFLFTKIHFILVSFLTDGFPEGKENFDKYFYQFITTPGFGDAYKLYIGARNESVIDVSEHFRKFQKSLSHIHVYFPTRLNSI